ncbi:hypothetical protein SAMD00020551_4711 [Mesobacillus selenatarsenatis SF-1]|uniref:Uncharacterized protein n=1 Tax=Mesobacillus selenatarsenatis (strain DSM 18680 / JCM 14380 / FERM P-15431 / SF-1) TaxID=1321606 RepID=A0A0A8X9A7_MESS1|nr:hypothetical protein SAMD00020551_4711 [Mesobacillus selenatarsenatis SF-1]
MTLPQQKGIQSIWPMLRTEGLSPLKKLVGHRSKILLRWLE